MSPLELRREFEAEAIRRKEAMEREVTMAWCIAALSRREKLPPLEELLRQPARRQTPEEQHAVLRSLSHYYGIPLREVVH